MIDSSRKAGASRSLALSMLLYAFAAHGQGAATGAMNEDNWKKLDQAKDLEQGYVAKLQLDGKSARNALATMLSEGFRCGIKPEPAQGRLPASATIRCTRDMSFLHGACSDVTVTLFPKWVKPGDEVAGRFEQLEDSPVEFTSVVCPYKGVGSEEYVQRQAEANAELTKKIAELRIERQRADQGFKMLLVQGFRCGLLAVTENGASGTTRLDCTRTQSQVDFCYQERLSIDLKGRRPDFAVLPPLQAMQESSIATVHSSCDLPLIESR